MSWGSRRRSFGVIRGARVVPQLETGSTRATIDLERFSFPDACSKRLPDCGPAWRGHFRRGDGQLQFSFGAGLLDGAGCLKRLGRRFLRRALAFFSLCDSLSKTGEAAGKAKAARPMVPKFRGAIRGNSKRNKEIVASSSAA